MLRMGTHTNQTINEAATTLQQLTSDMGYHAERGNQRWLYQFTLCKFSVSSVPSVVNPSFLFSAQKCKYNSPIYPRLKIDEY